MTGIVIQPSSSTEAWKHYQDTIQTEVNFLEPTVANLLSISDHDSLLKKFNSGKTRFWGVVPKKGKTTTFRRMKEGDVVLFTRKKRVKSHAIVAYIFDNEELARHLWGTDKDGNTWTHMFAVDYPVELDITYEQLNEAIGDKLNNKHQGFRVLNEEKSVAFIEEFIDNRGPIGENISREEFVLIIDGDLDTSTTTTRRKEQRHLKDNLFGNSQVSYCCICGLELPVELLRAAHIKKRTNCTRKEKLDYNVVMPACILGCDSLYEDGWIVVDSDGIIQKGRGRGKITSDLNMKVSKLTGTICQDFKPENSDYFRWHFEKWAQVAH